MVQNLNEPVKAEAIAVATLAHEAIYLEEA
jgi:hypothetical protein